MLNKMLIFLKKKYLYAIGITVQIMLSVLQNNLVVYQHKKINKITDQFRLLKQTKKKKLTNKILKGTVAN